MLTSPSPESHAAASAAAALSVLRSAHDAIVCCSADGAITALNASAERLYGVSFEAVQGQPVAALFAPARAEAESEALRRVVAGEPVETYDSEHRHADGRTLHVAVSLSAVIDPEGAPASATLFVRDISGRVLVAQELARTRAQLEAHAVELTRSNDDLEQFAYIASHDLSEPLRTITGMLSLLVEETDGALTDDAEDYVQRAVAGAERMRSLIDDLLLYSRMGRREAQRRDVDLGALADDVVEGLGAVIASSAACVEVTTPMPTVRADPVEVRQILQNLVSNGLKFNAGPTPRVTISAQREGAAWRVTVADDGIGIAPEFADRVFGPFKRLHTRDAYPGTGIGLAICRRIVERRGGRISLEHLPRGTAVHFTIPDAASDLEVAA